jgi:hypothetical protein
MEAHTQKGQAYVKNNHASVCWRDVYFVVGDENGKSGSKKKH